MSVTRADNNYKCSTSFILASFSRKIAGELHLPAIENPAVALDAQIGSAFSLIKDCATPPIQQKVEAIKKLLEGIPDSPSRKSSIKTITEIEEKVIPLNARSVSLTEKAANLTKEFWGTVDKFTAIRTPLTLENLQAVYRNLILLSEQIKPFKEEYEQLNQLTKELQFQVEKLTGISIDATAKVHTAALSR